MKKKSYFIKLLSFNILLVIISVSFLGYIAYLKTTSLMNEKIDKINSQLLFQTQMQIENSLQSVESAIVQFSLTPAFTSILEEDLKVISYGNYEKVRDFAPAISTLYANDSSISSIEIINLRKGWIFRNRGIQKIEDVYGAEEIRQIESMALNSVWNKVNSDYFQYTLRVPFSSFDKFQAAVRINVSANYIGSELLANKDLGEMTMIDADGHIIRNLMQYRLEKDEFDKVIRRVQSEVGQAPQGNFLMKINSVDSSVIFRQSAKYKWVYLSILSTLEAKHNSRFVGLFMFGTSFLVIGVFFIFSILGSRKLYSPIKKLYQLVSLNSGEKSNMQAQNNELDFINNRIQIFFQDSQQLKGQLEIQANQLNDFFAYKLFQGEISQQEMDNKFGHYAPGAQYCVLTVQIDTLEGTYYREKDNDLLLFAVRNMLGEITAQYLLINPVIIHNIEVCLIGVNHNHPEDFRQEVYVLSRSIQQAIKQYLKLQVSIGISNPFAKLAHTSVAYEDAVEALKSRIMHGREAIMYMADFEGADASKGKYPSFTVRELIDAIKFGDAEQSGHFLHSFVTEMISGNYGYRNCSMFVFLLLIDLIKISYNSDEMFLKIFKGKPVFNRLDELLQKSAADMEAWICRVVIQPLIEETQSRSETQQRNITKTLIQLIHDEYDTDLTLELCASKLYYNPNYLGQIFKKETGSAFNDYLSQYRLTVSKKLLADTDDQVQEIAEKLRFSNSQNFIRFFKKMEGMTPKQYRDNLTIRH